MLLKANQYLSEPHFSFFPFSKAWLKKAPNRLNVYACVVVNKFLLISPVNLPYFISYKLFRTETDASGTHGLYLEMPLEFIITIGNSLFKCHFNPKSGTLKYNQKHRSEVLFLQKSMRILSLTSVEPGFYAVYLYFRFPAVNK